MIYKYLGVKSGMSRYDKKTEFYRWHIKDLLIYDKPKELSEFRTICVADALNPYKCDKCDYSYKENYEIGVYEECCCDNLKPLKRPPQSWCYVVGKEDEGKCI